MEDGTVTLIGATTENPSFELNAALLSRARVMTFKALDAKRDREIAGAGRDDGRQAAAADAASARASGARWPMATGRAALTLAEEIWRAAPRAKSSIRRSLSEVVQRRAPIYDKGQEGHYNLISALHKTVRGSTRTRRSIISRACSMPAKIRCFIARRVVRMAVEDIGLADPQALVSPMPPRTPMIFSARPEGELAIAQAVIYVATAPKSNAAYMAYKRRAVGQDPRFADAAQGHPQRADEADEDRGLWRGLSL
jgi:putative ATPase